MNVWRRIYRTPVTTLVLVVLAAVYAGTHPWGDVDARTVGELRRQWGCVENLTWVPQSLPHDYSIPLTNLEGPFELWDGEWWRIPLCTLHHGDLLHLLLNSLFIATYGALFERIWGSGRYLLFMIAASVVSSLPSTLLAVYGIGFSGVCCAIYGALWGGRERDPRLTRIMTDENISAVMLILVVMLVATELELVRIDNLAHFTGIAYGWLIGMATAWQVRRPWLLWLNVVLSHWLLIIPMWYAVHPEWNGSYHWYLATRGDDHRPRLTVDVVELRKAVKRDPTLAGAWQMLAEQELQSSETLLAWQDLIAGLDHSPTDAGLWGLSRKIWRRLAVSEQRAEAIEIINRQFGKQATIWLEEIRRIRTPPLLIAPDQPPHIPTDELAERPIRQPWQPPIDPYWWYTAPNGAEHSHPVPPDDIHSALEGELL
ncbi:rhomboid family intramembrane serine protease [bacterium]|nr:rhomboid family intramembrane serine protease [bacterium]